MLGQWLWNGGESGRFSYQRTRERIYLVVGNFIEHLHMFNNCQLFVEKTKHK